MSLLNITEVGGICGLFLDEELLSVSYFATAGMIETLLYGVHFILFWICLYLLLRRQRLTRLPVIVPAIAMFAISTADIALSFKILSYASGRLEIARITVIVLSLTRGKDTLFVASNFVAELTLLYRCYMVWNRSKDVLVGCSLLIIADTVWGFLGMGPTLLAAKPNRFVWIYLWSIFAINIVLTSITIFRILWISNFGKGFLRTVERKQLTAYHTVIAILVESSLVYSVCIIFYLLWSESSPKRIFLIVVCMRIVGIMPTLLLVQVGLGDLAKQLNTVTTVSKFQARHSPSSSINTTDSYMHRDHRQERTPDIFRPDLQDEEVDITMQESRLENKVDPSQVQAISLGA